MMKIKVRTEQARFTFALPVRLAAWAVRRMPESIFAHMRQKIKEPYAQLATKENAGILIEACMDVLLENRGLEVIRVNTAGGDFISIVL